MQSVLHGSAGYGALQEFPFGGTVKNVMFPNSGLASLHVKKLKHARLDVYFFILIILSSHMTPHLNSIRLTTAFPHTISLCHAAAGSPNRATTPVTSSRIHCLLHGCSLTECQGCTACHFRCLQSWGCLDAAPTALKTWTPPCPPLTAHSGHPPPILCPKDPLLLAASTSRQVCTWSPCYFLS